MEGSNDFPTQKGATFMRTCFNGINVLQGVGILSVPYALSEGGWLSLPLLLLIAAICYYTGILLRRCMDSNVLIKTYPDIGELAFGRKGRILVSTFMYLELYLVAIEFLIMEGDNMEKLFPNARLRIAGIDIPGKQAFVLLAATIVLPTTWLRNLGVLAYVSFGGIMSSLILLVCVLWVGATDGVGFHERGTTFKWSGLPTALSLYVFCYSGHAVFPTIYTSMKDKTMFSKMLLVCFIVCTTSYGSMAILGYLMYGEKLQSQITLNMPASSFGSKLAIITTIINPIAKYALLVTPVAIAVEDWFSLFKFKHTSVIVRTLLVASTMIAALTLPFFGYLMALTGSFLSTSASILLPCICYLRIFRGTKRMAIENVTIFAIIILGSAMAMVGTYISMKKIVTHL